MGIRNFCSDSLEDAAQDFNLVKLGANQVQYKRRKGLVSKETVVMRRWGSETQKFGFIN